MSFFMNLRNLVVATLAVAVCVSLADVVNGAEEKKAKHVILFIGDGNGFNSELMGTYYHTGKEWGEEYHKFPVKLGAATFALHKHSNGVTEWDPVAEPEKNMGYNPEKFWKDPSGMHWRPTNTQLTDSAASGTAIHTGHKTIGGYVCLDPEGNRLDNISELFLKAGRAAGVISTNQISHATPATASSHNESRGNYEAIAKEQINDSGLTVLIGAGHPAYDLGKKRGKSADELNYQYVGGRELWEKVSANDGYNGWSFIEQREEFAEIAAATPDTQKELPARLLGIVRTTGDIPAIDGDADDPDAMIQKFGEDVVQAIPSLTEMTLSALNVLNQNENGFFLMVEGGNIDHANHANNATNSVIEHTGLAKAINAACEWVEKYSSWDETLMIITADHDTGLIWGEGTYIDENNNGRYDSKEDTFEGWEKIEKSPKGEVPAVQYLTGSHSNALVPVFAKGVGCEGANDFIRGNDAKAGKIWKFSGDFIYNSDIFNIMMNASGIE